MLDDQLVNEARALLSAFAGNEMRSMQVELRPGVQLSISRELSGRQGLAVMAPHVGTLSQRKADGELVRAGEAIATLDLLGEAVEIRADASGIVSEGSSAIGALVEFGEPLAWIEKDDC